MKDSKKINIFICSFIAIICIIVMFQSFSAVRDLKTIDERRAEIVNRCEIDLNNITNDMNEDYIDYCKNIVIPNKDLRVDFFTSVSDIIIYRVRFLNYIGFAIIIIPTLLSLCKILKNNFITNFLTRNNYKNFLKLLFKEAYKYIWVLPLLSIIIFIICATNSTFDPGYAILNKSSIWTSSIVNYPFIFIILYLLNLILHSITYVNIALIVTRKQHNYVLATILSILLFLGIELFLELIINTVLCNIILHEYNIGIVINIMNLFTFNDVLGTNTLLLSTVLATIISTIIVIILYGNKEKIIINCEKNNKK